MKHPLFVPLLILLLSYGLSAAAQQPQPSDKWIEYLEKIAEETDDPERIEALYAELSEIAAHPIDLNRATPDMLRRLPFLNDTQIDSIVSYRTRYGDMLTIYELKNIDALDWETIELMLPFVRVETPGRYRRAITLHNLLTGGKNELVLRYDRTWQRKKGYIADTLTDSRYLGEPFYHSIRYAYRFDERIQAGFAAEKDAGEPFLNRHGKGYDYISAHLMLRDIKRLKTFIIGDYKAAFGQGLVFSLDFTPGRSTLLSQPERRNNGFRRHYSTNEVDFLRGIASTVQFKQTAVSLFYAYRKLDATVIGDTITSFRVDGLHRTATDYTRRHNATMQTVGGNVRFANERLAVGITAIAYSFGRQTVVPRSEPYNRYAFSGSDGFNVGIDYQFRYRHTSLFGETAIDRNGAWATLNTLRWTPTSYASGLIMLRSYAADYHSPFANAVAQGGAVSNEHGLYAGMLFVPLPYWKVSVCADIFRFPWLKSNADAPSGGEELMWQVDFSPSAAFSTYLRYRYRTKERNHPANNSPAVHIAPRTLHRLRWQALWLPSAEWTLRSSVDAAIAEPNRRSSGWAIAQSVAWRPLRSPLQADLAIAYFDTDNYDSRLTAYEKKLPYVYRSVQLYGQGFRLAAVARYATPFGVTAAAKLGWTRLIDRPIGGSGLESIDGHNRTDIELILLWKF